MKRFYTFLVVFLAATMVWSAPIKKHSKKKHSKSKPPAAAVVKPTPTGPAAIQPTFARPNAAKQPFSVTNTVDWTKAKPFGLLGQGMLVFQHEYGDPAQIRVSAVRIDLKTPRLKFVGSHRDPKWGEKMPDHDSCLIRTKRVTTEDFYLDELKKGHRLLCAFNTTPWIPWDKVDHIYAHPKGLNLDGTNVISGNVGGAAPMFVAWKDGHCSIQGRLAPGDVEKVQLVHSGFSIIMKDGNISWRSTDMERHPRTTLGLSADGRYLYVLAVDGRQPGWSDGATVWECGAILRAMGASDAVNMDGGGSTTLLLGKGHRVEYLNRHNAKGTGWRRNAMSMGVYVE